MLAYWQAWLGLFRAQIHLAQSKKPQKTGFFVLKSTNGFRVFISTPNQFE